MLKGAPKTQIMRLKILLAGLSVLLLTASCKDYENNLDREILISNIWIEEHTDSQGATVDLLYDFDDGGIVRIYAVEGNSAVLTEESLYIFDPEEEILAIESLGVPLKVEEISPKRLKLRSSQLKLYLYLRKYTGKIRIN